MKRRRWLDPYGKYRPVDEAAGGADPEEPDEPPRELTPEERAAQRRAKLHVLLIAGVAVGGIVCMMVATAVVLWGLSR